MRKSFFSIKLGWFALALRALRYRNYRLFFFGQMVSLTGSWITTTATSWLVYRLTGSAFLLGMVGFATQFPSFLFLPFAGMVVDSQNRHRLLIATQALSTLQSFVLAFLTLTDRINVPWILILCAFQGIVNAFDMPCRQSFVVEMIEHKKDLGNAIALNSSMFNLARLTGPAIGGVIISFTSESWCFLIDGISYFAVIFSLFAMNVKPRAIPHTVNFFDHFLEGVKYVWNSHAIRAMIGLLAFVSLMGSPYAVLMPVFAGPILKGGSHTLGFLMSSAGAGALLAALWLAGRKTVLGLGRVIYCAIFVFGFGLIGFALSKTLWLSMLLLLAAGCGFMLQMASCNTILQTIVHDDKRGRVMSLYIMAFIGTAPFGSLLAGSLSQTIGAPQTLMICGLFCVGAAFWFYRQLPRIRQTVRPIYVTLGIIPEVASGMETTAELALPLEKRTQN